MEYLIGLVTVIGVGYTSYIIGLKEGGAKMIDSLEYIGIIIVDEEDNVWPNKQYNPK
jgi:hypothetical protein|tara:strand:+ start:2046 stop:2216 length:171 start_codon:yes stop_codon:yes gene_type:complete